MMEVCSGLSTRCSSVVPGARNIFGRGRLPTKRAAVGSMRRTAAGLAAGGAAACVTVIADREGDIYEEFAYRPAGIELLIRANYDRALKDGSTLYECMEGVPELGRETIDLCAQPGRPARQAVLALRTRQVSLLRPRRKYPGEEVKLPKEVTLTLVEAVRSMLHPVARRCIGGCSRPTR